ncbi:hypothetical protein AU468_00390 [Alkalispirochaeta sphaeroplastigenens]|uniref:bis(5'-nucleosyl)-tetraphosphatase (symmetrical) n=2 Tax=Alkalispirochaeta sphaeroplastigenens TaxID=1187066 RepID=A0A2S4K1N0_9SPIO|nr:hypothetical protein AU468_00390 [Alkalispirochaeta sphaeroplastigenens]
MHIIEFLRQELPRVLSRERYHHTLGVLSVAVSLGERFALDLPSLELAALAHDLDRERSPTELLALAGEWMIPVTAREVSAPVLLHGPVAAERLRREHHLSDEAVLQAVRHHTLGHPCFAEPRHRVGQALFVADFCEPGRPGLDAELQKRILALTDLSAMVREVIAATREIFGALEEPTEQLYARLE